MCEYYIITKMILERVDSAIQLNDVVAKKNQFSCRCRSLYVCFFLFNFWRNINMFWYVKINGTILPTPYRTMRDALDAIKVMQKELGPALYEPVMK